MGYKLKFWGVRGSIACPSPNHVVYGGNTSCIEFVLGDHVIVIDAGTGIRNLGHDFIRRKVDECKLLLTHTHWDHINGFPFFAPNFRPEFKLHIMAGHLNVGYDTGGIRSIQQVLASQMANPMFPVPLAALKAEISYEDFEAGTSFSPYKDVLVRTTKLNHPNGATGYRIEHKGKSVCVITDTEHVPGVPDQNVLKLIEGADLVIYDSTYTDDEFPSKVGWGHSTWQEGIRLCRAAKVKRLAIFHHDPDHDDQFMESLEDTSRQVWDGTLVARDNMELTLA
ncbi:MAG: MBL fold metallo-hydrolase [Rhodospirillales bacterium]|jgi:phosphoribosyl 1,2-cyclic phosphodiesterase|nr:MBL fold metallo-hydrolase [Rhodospirillales bacterium]